MSGVNGYMRSVTNRYYLTSTCVIEAEQTIQDANFINTTSWVTVASVRCRVLPAGQNDTERVQGFASQESIKVLKRLVVPHDTALDTGQRVTVGGELYQVGAIDVGNTDEVFRQVLIVQMRGADNDA
ncbi:hypothetical protein C8B47_10790 [filamentous cyanobacterium CCP4]|nr:hypothetical protein C8B47_10790 [filamentous cyanobacterium CCP4]